MTSKCVAAKCAMQLLHSTDCLVRGCPCGALRLVFLLDYDALLTCGLDQNKA